MRYLIAIVVMVAACGGAGATPGAVTTPAGHLVTGSLSVPVADLSDRSACKGRDGYSDVRVGSSVIVTDESGVTIGVTKLAGGTPTNPGCLFTFTVSVPDTAFYSVKVSQRAGPTWSRAEMEANGWKADLSLGG